MGAEAGRWLRAGLVGRSHGLDGSFYVRDPTPQLLDEGTQVLVAGSVRTIVRRAGDERRPIVRLDGYDGRAAVDALRGEAMMVEREHAPELEPDEWWEDDLVGCLVRDGERTIGTVRRLLGMPSVDVLEVERSDGNGQLLVPLVSDAVCSVDVEQKLIQVDVGFLGVE